MTVILFEALFFTLLGNVGIIISNQFSEKKIVFDKRYLLKSLVFFVLSVIAIYLYEYIMGNI